MVGHLVLDATPAKLGPAIAKLRKSGNRLNLNLLGEAVLGEREAGHRLQGTRDFLARDDVDYVSIKVSSVVSQLSMWSFDEAVADVVEKLTPALRTRREGRSQRQGQVHQPRYGGVPRPSTSRSRPSRASSTSRGLRTSRPASVLQAYLPDALGAMQHLQEWATARRAKGGAPDQGARRQGREPRDGRGRRRDPRLAARDLRHQAGLRHQLQAACSIGR